MQTGYLMKFRLFSLIMFAVATPALSTPNVDARDGRSGATGHRGSASSAKSYGSYKSHTSGRASSGLSTKRSPKVVQGTGSKSNSNSVRGHIRKDGSYVPPHRRTSPDKNFNNNWSTKPNSNPYTGKEGAKIEASPN